MSAELETFAWRHFDPRLMEAPSLGGDDRDEDGWQRLDEPIDVDIDEGEYVCSGMQMLNPSKRKMINLTY
jgi:hypothetical protein